MASIRVHPVWEQITGYGLMTLMSKLGSGSDASTNQNNLPSTSILENLFKTLIRISSTFVSKELVGNFP